MSENNTDGNFFHYLIRKEKMLNFEIFRRDSKGKTRLANNFNVA